MSLERRYLDIEFGGLDLGRWFDILSLGGHVFRRGLVDVVIAGQGNPDQDLIGLL